MYFLFQLLYSSVLVSSFLYFLSLCWSSHFVHSPEFSEHHKDCFIELFNQINYLPVSLGFFSGVLFYSFIWNSFLSFCLTFSFCFYELGKTPTSLGLEGLALCGSVPYVDHLHLAALTDCLELEWVWAEGRPWGVLHWGHLGGLTRAGASGG